MMNHIRHSGGKRPFGHSIRSREGKHLQVDTTSIERTVVGIEDLEGMEAMEVMEGTGGTEISPGHGRLTPWIRTKTRSSCLNASIMKVLVFTIQNIVIIRDRYSDYGCN